jgi:hypothetical protein
MSNKYAHIVKKSNRKQQATQASQRSNQLF